MRIYSRILAYAGPLKKCSCYYFLAMLLSIFFGLATYGLVIPLLKVLFNQEELNSLLLEKQVMPKSRIDIGYLTSLFNYYFIKLIVHHGKITALCLLAFLFMLSNAIHGFFRYIADVTMAKVRINLVHNLRLALFKSSLELPVQYFTDKKKGDLMSRITVDIQEIEHAVADILRIFLKEPTQLFAYISVLFYISPKLSLFTLLFLPIVGWAIAEIIQSLRKWTDQTQKSLGNLMNLIEESVGGIRIIKIFGAQQYAVDHFKAESKLYARTNRAVAKKSYMIAPISATLSVVAVSIILAYGGHLILLDRSMLTPSTFIAYIIICSQTLIPIKMISRSLGHIQRGIAAGRRIFDLLDEKSELKHGSVARVCTTFKNEIVFKNVSFSYNDTKEVLHQINFTIQNGETVALVGASGSGKSTLVSLLSGLYQPNSGTIEIDHLPIAQISAPSLHHLMGIVTQESILFHDTIFNNILLNRKRFTEKEVIKAAQIACAHHFIMRLPQGYHTIIGGNGNKLSGGQKQLICMARAILGNPPILVLDEATSALDSASERNLQEGLQQLIKDKTSVVVAHRLSTIYHADKIIVLDQGTIVEQGTHASLLAQGGVYKKLFLWQQN
ncbi:ABC transporter ATP-binding protein [Candidatus Cardinium sp. cBcalN1]|uniref:ABC transporter ATP-binding protein n=2 Tax=unclassified Candidatus Cardinium TaxID=2641185 RepID=UPI001FB511DD|nr:ABC transporter ATP-binding protein [Candidatus Cardinium sp. cBcalN1]